MSLPGGQEPVTSEGNISHQDLDIMKQELLREMRKEMQKIKNEIIDGGW